MHEGGGGESIDAENSEVDVHDAAVEIRGIGIGIGSGEWNGRWTWCKEMQGEVSATREHRVIT